MLLIIYITKFMQIWRIPMSPLDAKKISPGYVTFYVCTSMSEASPAQGTDRWYLIFYQN